MDSISDFLASLKTGRAEIVLKRGQFDEWDKQANDYFREQAIKHVTAENIHLADNWRAKLRATCPHCGYQRKVKGLRETARIPVTFQCKGCNQDVTHFHLVWDAQAAEEGVASVMW